MSTPQWLHLLLLWLLVPPASSSPAGAPIPSSLDTTATLSSRIGAHSSYSNISLPTPPSIDIANLTTLPGAWSSNCNTFRHPARPCVAICSRTDTACLATGAALVAACAPAWDAYYDIWEGFAPTTSGWFNVTSTIGIPETVVTTTVDSYTSFSTVSTGFRKQGTTGGRTTVTPVYALGEPVEVETLMTVGGNLTTFTVQEGPVPTCSFISVDAMDRDECGQCTIKGGTVDLYFWPEATGSAAGGAQTPQTTVLEGTTLVSPTAYIHLRTAYALDDCSVVGKEHTRTLVPVDPAELSTQIHIGGKVAAYEYGQLNYADLTGLPPASQYQMQPSCVYFGCPTMYSTTWFPTLKVPPQVRSIDPEWADCALGLEGLYDPPIALQPRAAQADPTDAAAASPTPASPSQTRAMAAPTVTWSPEEAADSGPSNAGDDNDSTSTSTITATAQIIASTRVVSINYSDGSQGSKGRNSAAEGDDSTSTSTISITETAQILASTRVISIDYSESAESPSRRHSSTDPTAPEGSEGGEVPETAWLDPTALRNGDGVVVGGQTLGTGEAITFGSGPSKTTLSLQTQASGATLLAFGTSDLLVVDPTGKPVEGPIPDLHHFPNGEYQIGSHTVSPGTVFTVPNGTDRITYSIFTRGSTTLFALGTTQTYEMHMPTSSQPVGGQEDLAFTQDSAGNFVLHGTTLLPGMPVVVGSGADKTTLAITSLSSVPAIVIDGSVTERLTHPPVSSSLALPSITSTSVSIASTPSTQAIASSSMSTSSESSAPTFLLNIHAKWLFMPAFLVFLVVG